MINEILLVQNLLDGIGINKACLFQHCYLLAKYYLQLGYEPVDVRRNIFAWANKYNLYLSSTKININRIIFKAQEDKRRLREDVVVRVSQKDLDNIAERFDNPKTRRIALAMLCYAKVAADSANEFELSIISFCNWLGVDFSRMHRAYLKELQTFGYVERISKTHVKKIYSWDRNVKSKAANFKLLVKFNNSGTHVLRNNDIDALFHECFDERTD